ncbi:hypothetical protein G5V59_09015 [Nocardioides sp. W3-2-3]|uniref:hypothetical protein n=1 Tax=Nocardioides convexus TaxID=2712224 RepID=UPI002418B969|nr:hypothetical protein [Nocardioides convexus]NHA00226.1 hypothetical protein [Nocardioides convexus]
MARLLRKAVERGLRHQDRLHRHRRGREEVHQRPPVAVARSRTARLAQDVDGDKVLDKYFHLKAWTINGRSIANGKDQKSYYWMMQGSSNVSDLSKISDENIGVFKYASVTLKYQNYIDRWFTNPPRSRPVIPSRVPKNVDPYAKMEMD